MTTEKEREAFAIACQPLFDYMRRYRCPNDTVVVTQTDAELVCGEICVQAPGYMGEVK